jgi:transcriptional regulator with XRE-family HTH domain
MGGLMNIDPQQVAGRILKLMQQLHLTQKEFAGKLQVTQPAVSKYIQGRIPPSTVLLRLAQLGGTSMEWVLTGGTPAAAPANTIAENQAAYGPAVMLAGKIDRLPPLLRDRLSALVEAMLQQLR